MQARLIVVASAVILGLLTGPSSLATASQSQPPISVSALAVMLTGSALGILFILGIQAARKDAKAFRFFWYFFSVITICTISTGLSAIAIAVVKGSLAPYTFVFLAIGAGMALGILALRALFSEKFITSD